MDETSKVYQVTHLALGVSFSRFGFTAIDIGVDIDGNGVDVSDESKNLSSKDLTTLYVRTLLDGFSVDMGWIKRKLRLLRKC